MQAVNKTEKKYIVVTVFRRTDRPTTNKLTAVKMHAHKHAQIEHTGPTLDKAVKVILQPVAY